MLALAAGGLADSLYLTWYRYDPAVRVCVVVRGCETVNQSPYATVGPVPVALIGLAGYALLVLLLLLQRSGPARLREPAGYGVYALSVGGTGFALYLTAVEAFVLRAFCSFCLLAAAAITGLCVLASLEMADRVTRTPPTPLRPAPGRRTSAPGRPPRHSRTR